MKTRQTKERQDKSTIKGNVTKKIDSIFTVLHTRHRLLQAIREFFYKNRYIEVETPNLTKTAPPDPYIDPLTVYIRDKGPFYLHTSPEMGMKKLLRYNTQRIFQICKVYREEELDGTHSIEFTMLEWYRRGSYLKTIQEVGKLIDFIAKRLKIGETCLFNRPLKIYDLEELFKEKTGFNPFVLKRNELIKRTGEKKSIHISKKDTWNDIFFKIFIQEIEPKIKKNVPYFIVNWPLSISTMAKQKGANKVERFELYINGLEIANGYTELLDAREQRKRFIKDNMQRKRLSKDVFDIDEDFLKAISSIKGEYTGVSLGVDRLLMVLLGKDKIDDVLPEKPVH